MRTRMHSRSLTPRLFLSRARLFTPFRSVSSLFFHPSAVSFRSYCSLLCPARSYHTRLRSTISHTGLMLMHVSVQRRRNPARYCDAPRRPVRKRTRENAKKFIRAIKNALRDFPYPRGKAACVNCRKIASQIEAVLKFSASIRLASRSTRLRKM